VTTSDFDENLYERMQNCLIERMRDTNESVADEALHAASHLQDQTDHFCPVINAYIYLLKQFNTLVDVRLKILDVLAINQKSLTLVRDLIYDKNARIRMSAYDLLRDKIKVKHLNDEYRWRLVKRIMDEDDKHLSDRLLKCLLSKWFNTDLDKDFLKLIKHLNIQKLKTDDEQASILNLLGFLYQKFDMDTLEDQFIANFALK
jgi:condensin complex subunit 3